jgi:hypothetical protein
VQKLSHNLKQQGYGMDLEHKKFRIPPRLRLPAMLWAAKVKSLPGHVVAVVSASIGYVTSRISVEYIAGVVSDEQVRRAVMSLGAQS